MRYHVRHTTTYAYSNAVSVCHNELHLCPRQCRHQTCSFHELLVFPEAALVSRSVDYFGNPVTFFTLQEPHQALTMTANSVVEVAPPVEVPPPTASVAWEDARDTIRRDRSAEGLGAYQFVFDSPYVAVSPELLAYAAPSFTPRRPLLEAVWHLTERIHAEFTYDPGVTGVNTPLDDVVRHRRGVCQDFAHLQIGCLRALGLAVRYVSGYLVTQPSAPSAFIGAEASHAWLSVYCPGHGWVDVDPTNNLWPSDRHITVAIGRDYGDVSPIKGVFLGGGDHTMEVTVDVMPMPS
jgi:transglutaminase-like putative cysteine protease